VRVTPASVAGVFKSQLLAMRETFVVIEEAVAAGNVAGYGIAT